MISISWHSGKHKRIGTVRVVSGYKEFEGKEKEWISNDQGIWGIVKLFA